VAAAVTRAAHSEGLAGVTLDDPDGQVRRAMWEPAYPTIEPI
jgi:malate dehydrogenase (oxaloacetate-decarboxylating)